MTENAAPEGETTDSEAPEAPTHVRVPNVSAGATSGLDHTVLGAAAEDGNAVASDAVTEYADHPSQPEAEPDVDAAEDPSPSSLDVDPAETADHPGSEDHDEAETDDEQVPLLEVPAGDLDSRVVWVSEGETEDDRKARADAVFGHERDAGDTDLAALGGRLTAAVYGSGTPIKGELVESDTAGTGAATTTDPSTGVTTTTQPGEPLPTITQEGGTPLDAAAVENAEPTPTDSTITDGTISRDTP